MSLDLSGIDNVNEFYSHHYLDELLEGDLRGLWAKWKAVEEQGNTRHAPPKALRSLKKRYSDILRQLVNGTRARAPDLGQRTQLACDFHTELLAALGYPQVSTWTGCDAVSLDNETGEVLPVRLALARDGEPHLFVIEAPWPATGESVLESPVAAPAGSCLDKGEHVTDAPVEEALTALFSSGKPPKWVVALGGRQLLLAERSRWGQGRYIFFDLDVLFDLAESTAMRAAAALLAADALCPDEGTVLHDVLDEASHRHAYGVSEDLKYSLREAVEVLANAYVKHTRETSKKKLRDDQAASLFDHELAKNLTKECLTYLYRLLFVLYAEARGDELGVLPTKSQAYLLGYSFEHLRDLELVPLNGVDARKGTFIHETLNHLFDLLYKGHTVAQLDLETQADSFTVKPLHASLFDRERAPLLKPVVFDNETLQRVLRLVSLSREAGRRGRGRSGKRKKRGRISYARLGINQLGAVYEGLLSYTGFFAQEDLYELKPAQSKKAEGDLEQVFFARESDLHKIEDDELVLEPDPDDPDAPPRPKKYPRGAFVYRLAGRDRERSASYYTPEVLTQSVVKYSLKELLKGKKADDILKLTVCEPAMGSGAFLNEAITQLAHAYLQQKQAELGQQILPADYGREHQRAKAYIATHNCYGVDLNPLAVDLAKVSLWLNMLGPETPVPWFDLHMGICNSLFGCRRQVFRRQDVLRKDNPKSRSYLGLVPEAVPLGTALPVGSIFHFLLPDQGMVAARNDKVAKQLAKHECARMAAWHRQFVKAPWTDREVAQLEELTAAADLLWSQYADRRQKAVAQTARDIEVWGQPAAGMHEQTAGRGKKETLSLEECEAIRDRLLEPTSPGRRLRLAMDAWCALWVWPIEQAASLPSRQSWLSAMRALLVGGSNVSTDEVCSEYTWLLVAQDLGQAQKFFHWELHFAELFRDRGGFDLLVGNPPWVNYEWSESGILSEFEPTIGIRKVSAAEIAKLRHFLLSNGAQRRDYLQEFVRTVGFKEYLNSRQAYSVLQGVRTNLYKCFLAKSWEVCAEAAICGLVHQPALLDDPKGGALREAFYRRLCLVPVFVNELMLFPEVSNHVRYAFSVCRSRPSAEARFDFVANLYHPRTIDDSLVHKGGGSTFGMKTDDGDWELRGHRNRVVRIDANRLSVFARLLDGEGTPAQRARLPVVHSEEMMGVLERFAGSSKLRDRADEWFATDMWNEVNQQKDGTIRRDVRRCNTPRSWVVSGPHFHIATPFNKSPNPGCSHNKDYTPVDLTRIPDDFLPRTVYVPGCPAKEYAARTPKWNGRLVTDFYRHVHRRRLAGTGERTLVNAIIPPGVGHLDQVTSATFTDYGRLATTSAFCSSLVADFFVRSTGKGDLRGADFGQLPFIEPDPRLIARALRLNCLTTHYAELWDELWQPAFKRDGFAKRDPRLDGSWKRLTPKWSRGCALRTDYERRQALVELDALAALAIGITVDELCTIYRVQFPVLFQYERWNRYDRNGRLVPAKLVRMAEANGLVCGSIADPDDPAIEYRLPFDGCDREQDMRAAYAALAGKPKIALRRPKGVARVRGRSSNSSRSTGAAAESASTGEATGSTACGSGRKRRTRRFHGVG